MSETGLNGSVVIRRFGYHYAHSQLKQHVLSARADLLFVSNGQMTLQRLEQSGHLVFGESHIARRQLIMSPSDGLKPSLFVHALRR